MNEKITLSGVPETMLQTVYARAKESRTRGAIHDAKAEEIISQLDYDFSLADKDAPMHSGVIARTIVLDKLAGDFLAKNPGAAVVNIACGLDTRCYRMTGYSHWYNLDLPETIAVREKLLPEDGAISQLGMSAMDDWGSAVAETDAPVLIIIEGLTMYLTEADVQRIFAVIAGRFPAATVFVETMNPMVVRRFKEKSIEGSNAKFTWGVKDGAALAALLPGFALIEEHSLTEGMAVFVPVYKVLDKLGFVRNISNKIIVLKPRLIKMSLSHIRNESAEEIACARDMFETIFSDYKQEKDVHISGLLADLMNQVPVTEADFTALEGKILLILPDQDFFSAEMQQDLIRLMHKPRIAYVSGGHLSTVLKTEDYIRTIRGFLAEMD